VTSHENLRVEPSGLIPLPDKRGGPPDKDGDRRNRVLRRNRAGRQHPALLGQRTDNRSLRSVDRECAGRVSSPERVNPRADVVSPTEGSTGAWAAKRAGLGGVLGQGMCTLGFPRNLGGSASLLPEGQVPPTEGDRAESAGSRVRDGGQRSERPMVAMRQGNPTRGVPAERRGRREAVGRKADSWTRRRERRWECRPPEPSQRNFSG
jgi:hypothetical protein